LAFSSGADDVTLCCVWTAVSASGMNKIILKVIKSKPYKHVLTWIDKWTMGESFAYRANNRWIESFTWLFIDLAPCMLWTNGCLSTIILKANLSGWEINLEKGSWTRMEYIALIEMGSYKQFKRCGESSLILFWCIFLHDVQSQMVLLWNIYMFNSWTICMASLTMKDIYMNLQFQLLSQLTFDSFC